MSFFESYVVNGTWTRLRAHSDRFFKRYKAIFVGNIGLNECLSNANIAQQFILITKLKKSVLPNAYIEL